ncbi:MAG: type II toxin-antitoxin system VapC family toxin, partial [Candidatus Hodarchaeales archaeon]
MIFVDTGAFFATKVINDINHQSAIRIEEKIREGKYGKMVTTNYILDELYTLLRARIPFNKMIQISESIRKSPNIRVIWILDTLEGKA